MIARSLVHVMILLLVVLGCRQFQWKAFGRYSTADVLLSCCTAHFSRALYCTCCTCLCNPFRIQSVLGHTRATESTCKCDACSGVQMSVSMCAGAQHVVMFEQSACIVFFHLTKLAFSMLWISTVCAAHKNVPVRTDRMSPFDQGATCEHALNAVNGNRFTITVVILLWCSARTMNALHRY